MHMQMFKMRTCQGTGFIIENHESRFPVKIVFPCSCKSKIIIKDHQSIDNDQVCKITMTVTSSNSRSTACINLS